MNKLVIALALVAFGAVAVADNHEGAAPAAPAKMEKKAAKKMKKAKEMKHEEHKAEGTTNH